MTVVHTIVIEVVMPQSEMSRFTITVNVVSTTLRPSCWQKSGGSRGLLPLHNAHGFIHDARKHHCDLIFHFDWVGMAIRVRVLGHPQVLDPTGAGVGVIFHPWVAPAPDPRRTGFGRMFHLSPASDPSGVRKRAINVFHPSRAAQPSPSNMWHVFHRSHRSTLTLNLVSSLQNKAQGPI
jgi:hypothetical protein